MDMGDFGINTIYFKFNFVSLVIYHLILATILLVAALDLFFEFAFDLHEWLAISHSFFAYAKT